MLPDIVPDKVSQEAIEGVAKLLAEGAAAGKNSALLLRGSALHGVGLEAAGRVQAETGARLICDTFAPHADVGAGRVPVERIPYFAEQIVDFLKGTDQIILVGSKPPVSFFAYPGKPSWCAPESTVFSCLAQPHEDAVGALTGLADALGAPARSPLRVPLALPGLPTGALTAMSMAQVIAELTPENVIFAEEAATSSFPLLMNLARARPHTHLPLAGGAIGQALPLAVGAAVAAPARKVVCPTGDGGAAMTMQALWTMARENLDITTVIYNNSSYAILNIELQRTGATAIGAGPKAMAMLDLHNPSIRWTQIAQGLGVEASRATTAEAFADQYGAAMKSGGPRLIEAMI
jgi:acetolactate synthase-1/2/3 large subunit